MAKCKDITGLVVKRLKCGYFGRQKLLICGHFWK